MAVSVTGGELDFSTRIDNSGAKKAEKELVDVIMQTAKAGVEASKARSAALANEIRGIDNSRDHFGKLKTSIDYAVDPSKINQFNTNINSLEREISQMSNAGREGFDQMGNAIEKTGKASSGFVNIIKGAIASFVAFFTINSLVDFGKQVVNITAEFGKLGAVLGNTFGSKGLAKIVMQQITDFAAKTPFAVSELTAAFVKLANQGFVPTGREMIKLGDLASSTGKSFDQLAEAILDSMTGENERLKEFGIKAKISGDQVTYTFKGVSTTIDNTSESIQKYILSLGEAAGVSGSMAVISKELSGQISNLGDDWDQMLVSVGSNTSGVFSGAISIMSDAIKKVTQFNKEMNTAEKYNLKSDFLQQVNRGINPFANKGATSKELDVSAIQTAESEIGKFVLKTIEGAKTAKDFKKAIADLNAQAKDYFAANSLSSKEAVKAVGDQYNQGLNNLTDAAKNFINKSTEPPKLSPTVIAQLKKIKEHQEAEAKETLAAKKALEQKVSDIQDEFTVKSLAKDKAEQLSLNNKFKVLATEIANFNKDPKHVVKIDTTPLKEVQVGAIADLTYRQETEKLKIEVEKQKVIFENFEQYKLNFGANAATTKYQAELAGFTTFTDYLKGKIDQTATDIKGLPTGAQSERLADLGNALAINNDRDSKIIADQFLKVFEATKTFHQKNLDLEAKYQKDLKALGANASAEQLAILKSNRDAQLAANEQSRLETLDFWKVLSGDINQVTKAGLRKAISDANDELVKLGTDPKFAKQVKEIKDKIQLGTEKLFKRTPEGLKEASNAFRELADTAGLFDENLGKALGNLSNMAAMAAKVGEGLKQAENGFSKGGDIVSGISGAIGAIGAAVGIWKGVLNGLQSIQDKKWAEKNEEINARNADALDKTQRSIEALTGALDRQAKIADRAFGVDRITAYKNQIELAKADIIKTIDAINKLADADTKRNHTRPDENGRPTSEFLRPNLDNLNQTPATSTRPSRGTSPTPTPSQLDSIDAVIKANQAKIESLYAQIARGKLDKTSEDQLRAQLAIYDELEGKLDEYQNKLRQALTGTSAGSLVDSIAEALRNNSSAEDYANNFKKLMQGAIMESLKLKALELPLKKFYEQFAKDAESNGGLDGVEVTSLRDSYNKIIQDAQTQFNQLQTVSGIDFNTKTTADSKSLSGAIKGITEVQADLLSGQFNGLRLTGIQHLNVAMQSYESLQRIDVNTGLTAQRLYGLIPALNKIIDNQGKGFGTAAANGRIP